MREKLVTNTLEYYNNTNDENNTRTQKLMMIQIIL